MILTALYSVNISMELEGTRAAFEKLTSGTKRVLLVEGHVWLREALAYLLNLDPDLLVVQQSDSLDELQEGAVDYDVILVDLDASLKRDMYLIPRLQECSSRAPLLALTSNPDLELHLCALEGGTDMLLPKSTNLAEILRSVKLLANSGSGAKHPRRGRL